MLFVRACSISFSTKQYSLKKYDYDEKALKSMPIILENKLSSKMYCNC